VDRALRQLGGVAGFDAAGSCCVSAPFTRGPITVR
jgi:hypothetical protein